jgi:hypothetical protein
MRPCKPYGFRKDQFLCLSRRSQDQDGQIGIINPYQLQIEISLVFEYQTSEVDSW